MGKIKSKVPQLLYGALTGAVCGAVITLFITCARVAASFAAGIYAAADAPLFIVCVITLALVCCLITAVVQTLCPYSSGSGIPLAEACARGMLKVKWLRTAAALIVGSLAAFTCGMSVGSEGPSVGVGGLIGDGVGKLAKKPVEFRRYLITGGASAGLAVAFNAPLTGITFALEETHRRFSAGILVAAFSAVVPAVVTSQLMLWGLQQDPFLYSVGVRAGAAALPYLAQQKFTALPDILAVCGVAAVCGILIGGLGSAFNGVTALINRLLKNAPHASIRLLPAFILTACCGIALHYVTGSGEAALEHIYLNGALWLVFTVLAVRFALTALASGSGVTGGLFLPMIAIGGLFGLGAGRLAVGCGMSEAYIPNVVIMCVCAFFAACTRAPVSAIALSLELTASFANLLPCAITVGVATAVAGLLKTAPLYERVTEQLCEQALPLGSGEHVTVRGTVPVSSGVCGLRLRDILWPYNCLVTELKRGGTDIVPDGETTIAAGDALTVRAERVQIDEFTEQMGQYIQVSEIKRGNYATRRE